MNNLKTIKEAVKIVLKEGKGYREELIQEVGSAVIVNELAQLGYISQGATVNDKDIYQRTWRKTKKAENYARFFIDELTDKEKKMGRNLHSFGF